MNPEQLKESLDQHKLWLSGNGGKRADLSGANLSGANLSLANLTGAKGICPSTMLLANWGYVSDKLCKKLMAFDAQNHPKPELFNKWKETGDCPYVNCGVERVCNFEQRRELWEPELLDLPTLRPYDLMVELFAEKGIKF